MKTEAALTDITDKLTKRNVDLVFGPTREFKDRAIIPVGMIMYGFGAGAGKGKKEKSSEKGEGSGLGGGGRMMPWGYIEITAKEVRYKPVYNLNMMIAMLGSAALVFLMIMRTVASRMKKAEFEIKTEE